MNSVLNIVFPTVPTFHQLWEACMESHLTYTAEGFAELEILFDRCGVVHASKILDTCCGSGSLDIELLKRGYSLATMDGDPGMLGLFRQKLEAQGIGHEPKLAKWRELPGAVEGESFDAMICCGNSLIYAGGYWNSNGVIDRQAALGGILETLTIFRAQLRPGGVFLVDKPRDDEEPVEELVAHLRVANGEMYDVFFSVRFDELRQRRTAQILLRHQATKVETGVPNVAYHLKDAELEVLLREAGFSSFERIVRDTNDRFPLWVARV